MENNYTHADVAGKTLIDMKKTAEILGLKYHTARKMLFEDSSIGYVDYGGKKLWILDDILEYKRNHYIKPSVA